MFLEAILLQSTNNQLGGGNGNRRLFAIGWHQRGIDRFRTYAAQFAHTKLLSLILFVEREWQALDSRKFGVGNISIANGLPFGHKSHMKGLEVDVRPLRKDGQHAPVSYTDPEYDRAATSQLIALFRAHAVGPFLIFFNDLKITGVIPLRKHDDHFHFQFN
ncbi:MAG: penicillin-insensitive murein endopeptidase [Burkholderiaceae bacterium]|nr:penicillin-insensitive murein endopeptidase [Burkholderiaceae bacterium]